MPNFIKTTGRGLMQLKHRSVKSAGAGTKRACFKVLAAARQAGFSFAAGVATPSDIEAGLEQQCDLLIYSNFSLQSMKSPGNSASLGVSRRDGAIVAWHEVPWPEGPCPKGAGGLSPGFQPWEPPPRAIRPEGAADRTY